MNPIFALAIVVGDLVVTAQRLEDLDRGREDVPPLLPEPWDSPSTADEAKAALEVLDGQQEKFTELFQLLAGVHERIRQEHYRLLLRVATCRQLLAKPSPAGGNTPKRGPGRPSKKAAAESV